MPRTPPSAPTPQLPAQALLLGNHLCFAVHSTALALHKVYRPLLQSLGLTYPQYLVMLVLWETDGLSIGELGERLLLDSGTLTPLVKRLEAAGLVLRERDAQDERRVIAHLTSEGKRLHKRALGVPACVLQASGCSAANARELTTTLTQLRERLTSHSQP